VCSRVIVIVIMIVTVIVIVIVIVICNGVVVALCGLFIDTNRGRQWQARRENRLSVATDTGPTPMRSSGSTHHPLTNHTQGM
jgi:hypothetical protein